MISNQNILELETRRRIYNLILQFPGLHIREISRKLKIPKTTLKYHLDFLKKRDLLVSVAAGKYLNYFVKEKIGRNDKKIISLLRKDTTCKIILCLLTRLVSSQAEISRDLEKHSNTIAPYLKKLLKFNIIEPASVKNRLVKRIGVPGDIEYLYVSNEKLYQLKDPLKIYDLIMVYKDELNADDIEALIKVLYLRPREYLNQNGKPPRKRRCSDQKNVDSILEIVLEIFPHPYHV